MFILFFTHILGSHGDSLLMLILFCTYQPIHIETKDGDSHVP